MIVTWYTLPDVERRARPRAQSLARVLAGGGRTRADRHAPRRRDRARYPRPMRCRLDAPATIPRRRILSTLLETLPISAR
jgi:hypothetical protein